MQNFGCISSSVSVQIPCAEGSLQAAVTGPIVNSMDVSIQCETHVIHWSEKMKYHGQCFVCLYQELLPLDALSPLQWLVYVLFVDTLYHICFFGICQFYIYIFFHNFCRQ